MSGEARPAVHLQQQFRDADVRHQVIDLAHGRSRLLGDEVGQGCHLQNPLGEGGIWQSPLLGEGVDLGKLFTKKGSAHETEKIVR